MAPSVSSTSTITQPVHNLLQTSSGILLPKRQATTSSSAAPALSTHSTASSSSLALPSPTLSASSSSSSLDQTYKNNASNHMNGPTSSTNPTADMSQHTSTNGRASSNPILVLEPLNDTFALKSLDLPEHTKVKIGRQTGVTTAPIPSNGYFDSKVLSRVHAEVWSENGKVFIRDLKSSNGTFLNGKRLCPENVESEPFILNQGDNLEFGIDILDENGALLHEKVACKIYISRMSYPTPGGSPQEAHAKLKSGSPSGSGSNSFKSNSGSNSGSGLSANIDLIISRLQNELTRSQETNGDLGALKQGLGELEKAFVVTGKDSKSKTDNTHVDASAQVATALAASAAEHEKKLEETQQAHSAQVLQLTTTLKETKAELAAYVQKTQLLEPLVAEDEILRAKFAQTTADLNKTKAERDSAKDGMNKLINEHQQAVETLRKEQEAALARLEEAHKTTLEQITRETAMAQDVMSLKHQQELAQIAEVLSKQEIQTTSTVALESEIATLKTQVQSLQETARDQVKLVQELKSEKAELHKKLEDTNAELSRTTQELEAQREKNTSEDLSSLTPTSPTSPSTASITTKKSTSSSSSSQDESVSKYEFSWSQFVFPMAKKNPSHPQQPPTIFLSGGFMLVGLGAYVLWHKAGLVSN
ncbi:hypothetical protein CPC16_010038 [Podila verticillata]|nr:hypothetical protein CPC16_010038 [Podila verticillata]